MKIIQIGTIVFKMILNIFKIPEHKFIKNDDVKIKFNPPILMSHVKFKLI